MSDVPFRKLFVLRMYLVLTEPVIHKMKSTGVSFIARERKWWTGRNAWDDVFEFMILFFDDTTLNSLFVWFLYFDEISKNHFWRMIESLSILHMDVPKISFWRKVKSEVCETRRTFRIFFTPENFLAIFFIASQLPRVRHRRIVLTLKHDIQKYAK